MTNLTLWKKEASDKFWSEFGADYIYYIEVDDFLEALIDRIHAHTLEEVREEVKTLYILQPGKDDYEHEQFIGRNKVLHELEAALELLEHPTGTAN